MRCQIIIYQYLKKISRFVMHDIILNLAKNLLNQTKARYHVIPKTVTSIFHREIVIFPYKICCNTLVCNISAHLLLWAWNSKSHLFFEMQQVTKIKYQINVCSLFIKTQRKCKCVINEKILDIATVIVMKIINVNLYKKSALSSDITSSSIIVMIIEAKTQWSNFTKHFKLICKIWTRVNKTHLVLILKKYAHKAVLKCCIT